MVSPIGGSFTVATTTPSRTAIPVLACDWESIAPHSRTTTARAAASSSHWRRIVSAHYLPFPITGRSVDAAMRRHGQRGTLPGFSAPCAVPPAEAPTLEDEAMTAATDHCTRTPRTSDRTSGMRRLLFPA